jgi:hypothetical protein
VQGARSIYALENVTGHGRHAAAGRRPDGGPRMLGHIGASSSCARMRACVSTVSRELQHPGLSRCAGVASQNPRVPGRRHDLLCLASSAPSGASLRNFSIGLGIVASGIAINNSLNHLIGAIRGGAANAASSHPRRLDERSAPREQAHAAEPSNSAAIPPRRAPRAARAGAAPGGGRPKAACLAAVLESPPDSRWQRGGVEIPGGAQPATGGRAVVTPRTERRPTWCARARVPAALACSATKRGSYERLPGISSLATRCASA